MTQRPIYLDCHATTPVDPRVMEAMIPFFTQRFGNAASSNHIYGWEAEAAVKQARDTLAAAINASPEEIVFTSGATEANNLAIKGVAEAYFRRGKHIITVQTEHNAVLDPCTYLASLGFEITVLPVQANGLVNLDELESALREDTILVSVMAANNDTKMVCCNPWRKLASAVGLRGCCSTAMRPRPSARCPWMCRPCRWT